MAKPINIAIRTDASANIGSGHLMRTLALADELRARGANCIFICRECPDFLQGMVRTHGHKLTMFTESTTIWNEIDDAVQTMALCGSDSTTWMIVDHYQLSASWEATIRAHVPRLMVIDDLANRVHVCDLLMNQNLGRSTVDYADLVPEYCSVLLGPSYALLRPQFSEVRERSKANRKHRNPRNILISLGGTDPVNATCAVLGALRYATLPEDSRLHIVLGENSPFRNEVELKCLELPWPTTISLGVSDMAALMAEADIAISAGGSTLWELFCAGVPTIAIKTADNQGHSCRAIAQAGAAYVVDAVTELPAALPLLLRDLLEPRILARMQDAAARITDGLGCTRVADVITQTFAHSAPTILRTMRAEDLDQVRHWRNHPDVKRYMHNPYEIGAEEHAQWFERCWHDPSQHLLIAEEAGSPIGFVRFACIDQQSAEWGFYKVPGAPAGSGTRMGRVALNYAFDSLALESVRATVLSTNQRSLRFHRNLGFRDLPTKSAQSINHFTISREEWLNGNRL